MRCNDADVKGARRWRALFVSLPGMLASFAVAASPAIAATALQYQYDALGRITEVAYVGGDLDGQKIVYSYDATGNRTATTITGPSHPRPLVIEVMMFGRAMPQIVGH